MMDVERDIPASGPGADLEAQARAWIVRLKSGGATEQDLLRLARWRACSPAAEAAFAEARLMWGRLGPALAADADSRVAPFRPRLSRRAILGAGGGAIAAGIGGVAYMGGLGRDAPGVNLIATAKGERRRVVIAAGAMADLNTGTRVRIWSGADGDGLELLAGEVLLTLTSLARPVIFVAKVGGAFATAEAAQFLMRRKGGDGSILCLQGRVQVKDASRAFTLEPRSLLRMDADGPVVTHASDVEDVVAWRSGQLVYEDRALADVVEELNRYRKGRIIVRGDALARRRVSGVVHLDRIDGALTNFARSLDAPITRLPGGVVILG